MKKTLINRANYLYEKVLKSNSSLLFIQDFSNFIVYKNVPEKKREKTYLPCPKNDPKKYLKTKKNEDLKRKNMKEKLHTKKSITNTSNYLFTHNDIIQIIYTLFNYQFYLIKFYNSTNHYQFIISNYTSIINSIIYKFPIKLFTIKFKLFTKLIAWSKLGIFTMKTEKTNTKNKRKAQSNNNIKIPRYVNSMKTTKLYLTQNMSVIQMPYRVCKIKLDNFKPSPKYYSVVSPSQTKDRQRNNLVAITGVKSEQLQSGEHRQPRVEPHPRPDLQRLHCLQVAHVHLLDGLRVCTRFELSIKTGKFI